MSKTMKALLVITMVLGVAQVLFAIADRRPSSTARGLRSVTVEGTLAAYDDRTLTLTLTKRRGLLEYLASAGASRLTIGVTADTTYTVRYASRERPGDVLTTSVVDRGGIIFGDQLIIAAHPSPSNPRQLDADTVTAVRAVSDQPLPPLLRPDEPKPQPALLR